MERLYDKLKAYSESDFYAFHMPGHKRNKALLGIELPYDLDITEIDGFDDLHHADGILKEEQERAARVFGAEESHFLVNGSTAGILSAVMGCTHRGDKILVARHCHKSIYHAIYMNGLVPRYVYPEFDISMHMNGEISKEDVAKALAAEPDIKAVVIVSEDQKKALVGYYRVMQPVNVGFKRLKLKGLKEDTCYKVSGYAYDCYGDELMQVGMILSDSASGVWKKGVNDKGDFQAEVFEIVAV